MAHQSFDHSEFVSLRYYLGTYGSTAATDRVNNYYGYNGTPDLIFNGTTRMVGAGTDAADGEGYMDIIRGRYFDPSPIRIDVDSFDPVSGDTSVTVTMYSTTYSITDEKILLVLIEDDVNTTPPTYDDTHVTRDIYSETFSLTGIDNTAVINTSFTIDSGWDTTKLRVVAFVQLADQSIIQTGSSDPQPSFKARAMVPFSRNAIGPSDAVFETDSVTVINLGQTDSFTIDVVIDYAPPGWTAAFKDDGGFLHTDPLGFGLTEEESTTFKAVVTPTSPGYMQYHLEITSLNLSSPLEIPFVFITDDVDILVVDDDGGEEFEDYITAALDTAGKTYGVWNRGLGQLTSEAAQTSDVMVWSTGLAGPTLDSDDKVFLGNYLDSGKALFLNGQDIGWDLNDANPDPVWYQTYLHSIWIRDDTNIMYLNGVSGDPVSDGMVLHIIGGTGASNQEYPDEIEAADADATEIFFYQGDGCGAIRSIDSASKARLVYLGFGFEGIDEAQDRHDLMVKVIGWIGPDLFTDGFESSDTNAWSNTTP